MAFLKAFLAVEFPRPSQYLRVIVLGNLHNIRVLGRILKDTFFQSVLPCSE